MNYVDIIGLIAGAMGGFALFPQVLKVLKTKSTKDISREMFLLLAGSIILWLIYGILLNNFPIMIANFFGIIQASVILYFKIKNQLREPTLIHAQAKYAPKLPIYPANQCNSDSESKVSKDILERKYA